MVPTAQNNQDFTAYETAAGVPSGYISDILSQTNKGINNFAIPPELFRPLLSQDFESQATGLVSPYYDKSLQLALQQLDLAKTQQKQLLDVANQQQAQNEGQYGEQRDYTFQQALRGAQNGYAGRGTQTSGFRQYGIGQTIQGQNLTDQAKALGFAQLQQNRDVGYSQFLDTNSLQQKVTTADITRQKNQAILQSEQGLANAATGKQNSIINALNQGFSQFLGLNQAISA